ncbi:exonuclease RecJ [Halorussus marinus]|uniref:exonuclease RecJ n=1 Tax=Halorussus marinus TaxID=2505976 RepID=UPI00106E6DA3|nr:exonuclease RecJ [Halorussus marinus]
MSTSGRRTADGHAPDASDVAATLRESEFVRLLARADGDCLAAAGLLAGALAERGVPYQVRVGRFGETLADGDRDATVGVGLDPSADAHLPAEATPASATAFDAAGDLDASPDPALALAGVLASDAQPRDRAVRVREAARESGVERRPGVGVPTDDLADGLAHTTLAHADYSGDAGAAQATLAELGLPAELDESARRTVASEFALAVTGGPEATARAAEAVERALRPHALADGPFATVEGYADVLAAVARERPGTASALALGHDARTDALDAWRDHARAAHGALRAATTARYDGLFAARTDAAPVETVARLLRDFRSPEPVALVVTDEEAAAAATDERAIGAAMTDAVNAVGGVGGGTARRGYARFDPETDAKEFLTAFREANA